jgi:hypothetical protein
MGRREYTNTLAFLRREAGDRRAKSQRALSRLLGGLAVLAVTHCVWPLVRQPRSRERCAVERAGELC